MTIIVALLIFGFIVLVHELGHFLVAKKNGVQVHEFAIGMGPKLFSIKRETEYIIKLFPVGGYCLMEDEDSISNNPKSFNSKSVFQRASILFAGPLFNIIFAIIILIPVFMMTGTPTTTVQSVDLNSPAQIAGLNVGDKILYINGAKISNWSDVGKSIQSLNEPRFSMTIDRNGEQQTLQVIPEVENGTYKIGVTPTFESHLLTSITTAFKTTMSILSQMVVLLVTLFTGSAPGGVSQSLTGPLGIIELVGDASRKGLINVFYLTSIISLNLGLMNLLPIPALDGGRLAFLGFEALRGGKKINPEKEGLIHLVGFTLLMGFTIFITCQDIIKLLS